VRPGLRRKAVGAPHVCPRVALPAGFTVEYRRIGNGDCVLTIIQNAGLLVCAYLVGAVPFAYIIAKWVKGVDIRTAGSGNAGATNVSRVVGRKWGIAVFALDALKGFLVVAAAEWLSGRGVGAAHPPLIVALAALAAIAGHNWPVYLGFRGGKGMAVSCGAFLAMFPLGLLIAMSVWALVAAVTRYVSVASMAAGLVLLVTALTLQHAPFADGKYLTAISLLACILAIVRHRSNIRRLVAGTEHKIGQNKAAE
jgi:acyl phosphate:glycerol-3-phosphate acyltransferase